MEPPPPVAAAGGATSSASQPPQATKLLDDGTLSWQGDLWKFETKLGAGRFAAVYRLQCTTCKDKQPIAAKVTQLKGISSWARAQLSEELAIWQTLRHPNVVRLHGHVSDGSRHVLLLELARGGELFERIVKMQSFCEEHAARQVSEVLSALEYLHSFGVLHRDLKPENLLLESDAEDAPVKVADFGASKLVITTGAKTPCGSLGYAAPEQLRGLKFAQSAAHVPPYDKEVDLWSVGVITYILLSGSMPFDPATYSAENLARKNALEFPPGLFGQTSPEARDFISSLLQVDPAKRLSAAAALRHPWLRSSATSGADEAKTAAATALPTPTARLTPLPTPRRLKELQASGHLKKAWAQLQTAEAGRAQRPLTAGAEAAAVRELAGKRAAEEMEDSADVPTLCLPAEVSKRLRSNESAASASSEAAGSTSIATNQ